MKTNKIIDIDMMKEIGFTLGALTCFGYGCKVIAQTAVNVLRDKINPDPFDEIIGEFVEDFVRVLKTSVKANGGRFEVEMIDDRTLNVNDIDITIIPHEDGGCTGVIVTEDSDDLRSIKRALSMEFVQDIFDVSISEDDGEFTMIIRYDGEF